ncbi:MAG TPA: ROK family protein [Firmicutes bacterium]|nr:ROK family protein [Bacillota bacterium]
MPSEALVHLLGKRSRLIHHFIHNSPLTRADIMAISGASQPTVTQWLRELIDAEVVHEVGISPQGSALGRPRVLLELNPEAAWVGAMHLTSVSAEAGLVNLRGEVVASEAMTFTSQDMAYSRELFHILIKKIATWVRERKIADDQILGIGVATSGPVNNERGTVASYAPVDGAAGVTRWERTDFPIRDYLAASSPWPFYMETNAWAIALSERWLGTGYKNFVLVHVSEGVAAGTVLNHQLYRGNGLAGELHPVSIVPENAVTLAKDLRYRLYDIVGRRHILERLHTFREYEQMRSLAQVIAAARQGDSQVLAILRECADALAQFCIPVANLLDLDAFILSGPIFQIPEIIGYMQQRIAQATFSALMEGRAPLVIPSTFGANSGLMGAAGLVFDQVFN